MKKKNIIIAPFAKTLRNGKPNPKNFPYWPELIRLLEKDYHVIQIGVKGEPAFVKDMRIGLSLKELKELLLDCKLWISCDSFFQHLAHHNLKAGVVIWSVSDHRHFGYDYNINILKDRKYLRPNQFDIWETQEYNKDAFLSAKEVYAIIKDSFPP